MIEVSGLTKRFGDVTAVDNLSFTVDKGELFALLGTNGAGKSTTIGCLTTLLVPDGGTACVAGLQIGRQDHQIRERIGVVFQQSLLDPMLTVNENLLLRARFSGIRARVSELSQIVGLEAFRNRRYGVLSGGEKRRVDIARALLSEPQILFLDEPTAGLDPQSRETVWQALSQLREKYGLTVVLTTHYMQETEDADHVLIIDSGHALAEGTPFELRTKYSGPVLEVAPAPDHWQETHEALERAFPNTPTHQKGGAIRIRVPSSQDALPVLTSMKDMITTFSTGLAALGVYVDDRVSGRFKEFRVSALRRWQLVLGYQIASVTVAATVSIGVLIIGAGLLQLLYGKAPSPTSLLTAAALTVLLSTAFAALSSFILTFVKTSGAYTAFSTISGTLLGFLAGAYLPLGLLSEQVRNALNVLPFSPSAMLLRDPLAGKALDQIAGGISEVREGVGTYYGFRVSIGELELTPLVVIAALLALTATFTALGTWRVGRTVV